MVVVHVGAVNIYVAAAAAVEALRKKERRGQKRMKLRLAESAFLSLTPSIPFAQQNSQLGTAHDAKNLQPKHKKILHIASTLLTKSFKINICLP